jgi:hypothetical protein
VELEKDVEAGREDGGGRMAGRAVSRGEARGTEYKVVSRLHHKGEDYKETHCTKQKAGGERLHWGWE